MSPTVSRADARHLDGLADLFDGYRQFYRRPSDRAAARRFLADRLAAEESVIFAAWLDGAEPVGFVQLFPFWTSVGMRRVWVLNDLFVAEGARRRGVARALMEAARAFGVETGAARVELATEVSNADAQALYDDLGYARDAEYHHYALALDGPR